MATAFYETYRQLCQKVGKSDNAVAAEIGLSNSTVTTWRQGALPRRPTIKKVADYFGVSVEEMMGYIQIDKYGTRHTPTLIPDIPGAKVDKYGTASYEPKEKPTIQTESEPMCLEGTYLRLAQGAQELGLDDEDVDAILAIYAKHRQKNQ